MRLQALILPVIFLFVYSLATIAQSDFDRLWHFPFRVTLANGEGNSNPNRPTSFVDDASSSLDIDLSKPFTMLSWLSVADRKFWRTAMSIESSLASGALFRIGLPPDHMNFNVAWMRDAHSRGGAINTTAVAPALNRQFHFALVKTNQDLTIYIDGVRRAFNTFNNQIFNPPEKQIVLGRTKLYGNTNRAQWNGIIRDAYIFDGALTRDQIVRERERTMREV